MIQQETFNILSELRCYRTL